jgi:hypothetical protein
MTATIIEEQASTRPEFFRLPKPGNSDKFFGLSRSFYYSAEKRGWLRLIRIRDQGKERGVTLIPYQAVAEFVRSQAEAVPK